jgi:hypothetical protein
VHPRAQEQEEEKEEEEKEEEEEEEEEERHLSTPHGWRFSISGSRFLQHTSPISTAWPGLSVSPAWEGIGKETGIARRHGLQNYFEQVFYYIYIPLALTVAALPCFMNAYFKDIVV